MKTIEFLQEKMTTLQDTHQAQLVKLKTKMQALRKQHKEAQTKSAVTLFELEQENYSTLFYRLFPLF